MTFHKGGLRVGDLGNSERHPGDQIHLPTPCSRAQSSRAQDTDVIFHTTSLWQRAEDERSNGKILNVHFPSNNPYFSGLDRLARPRE